MMIIGHRCGKGLGPENTITTMIYGLLGIRKQQARSKHWIFHKFILIDHHY